MATPWEDYQAALQESKAQYDLETDLAWELYHKAHRAALAKRDKAELDAYNVMMEHEGILTRTP